MKRRNSSRAGILLLACGIALLSFSIVMLCCVQPLLQYSVCAPDVHSVKAENTADTQTETGLDTLAEAQQRVREQLSDGVCAIGCCGYKSGAAVENTKVSLFAVDECRQEIYPKQVIEGRWMDSSELKSAAKVAVLDEELAFKLFGSETALNKEAQIEGTRYRVIGTVRHKRTPGEADAFGAYVPLRAVSAQGVQLDTITMSAVPLLTQGMDESFRTVMHSLWGAGSFCNTKKEALRRLILPGFAALILLLGAWAALAARWMRYLRRCTESVREMRRHGYFRSYAPAASGMILFCVLTAAALLAGVYALLHAAIQPVYTFTEWIPESLVEISAIRRVFWNLAAEAAQPVKIITPEAANIAFYGALARWGTLLSLLGLAGLKQSHALNRIIEN